MLGEFGALVQGDNAEDWRQDERRGSLVPGALLCLVGIRLQGFIGGGPGGAARWLVERCRWPVAQADLRALEKRFR